MQLYSFDRTTGYEALECVDKDSRHTPRVLTLPTDLISVDKFRNNLHRSLRGIRTLVRLERTPRVLEAVS